MHRQHVGRLLSTYRDFWIDSGFHYPNQKLKQELKTWQIFVEFVDTQAACFDRELELGHITGSALVLDEKAERLLLLHHKKLNKWLQLGGHSDSNPNSLEVALKEAYEESGLTSLKLSNWFERLKPASSCQVLDLDIHAIPERKKEPAHYHYDIRFVFKVADGNHNFVINEEANELRWVAIDKVSSLTDEESMLRQVDKLMALRDFL